MSLIPRPAIDIGIPETHRAAIAEGHLAPFGGSTYGGLSSILETEGVPAALAMVRELVEGHEAVARTIRSVFAVADEAGDQPTADLLTQRLQIHEKTA